MNLFIRSFATGLFTGYLPKMPGTWGSIAAAVFWWFIPVNVYLQSTLIVTVFLIGVVTSAGYARVLGTHDPAFVVIDEWVGMWIALFILPHQIYYFIIGIILFRFFDITKPLLIHHAEKLPNGWGIMTDDVMAGVYSRIILLFGVTLYGGVSS